MSYSRRGIFKNPQLLPLIIVTVISTVMIVLPLDLRTTVSRVGTLSLLYPFSEMNKYLTEVETTFLVNRDLNRRLDSLTVVISRLIENQYENDRLRLLLDFEKHPDLRLVPAEVTSITFGYPYKSMVISVGYEKNIAANMPVISPDGIIGKTLSTGWRASTVQLIYDPACRVAAKVKASRAHGILTYNGGKYLTLKDVPLEESVLPGDSVITSGLGGIFPEGLFIGTVVRSGEKEGGLFHEIRIMPGANFASLDEVFVVASTISR